MDEVDNIITSVSKKFQGTGIVDHMFKTKANPHFIPTGSVSLDLAIKSTGSIAGVPSGIIEIFGKNQSGKSALCLQIAREAIKKYPDKYVIYLDYEKTTNDFYLKDLKDSPNFKLPTPIYAEEGFTQIEKLCTRDDVSLIVVDSVGNMSSKAELDSSFEDRHVAEIPRLLTKACKKFAAPIYRNDITLIMINQIRDNISGNMYAKTEDQTPGGNALKHSACLRISLSSTKEKRGEDIIGHKVNANIVKNKLGFPYGRGSFYIRAEEGFAKHVELFYTGIKMGVIQRHGNTYSYGDDKLGVGATKAEQAFMENEKLQDEVERKIKNDFFKIDEESSK